MWVENYRAVENCEIIELYHWLFSTFDVPLNGLILITGNFPLCKKSELDWKPSYPIPPISGT